MADVVIAVHGGAGTHRQSALPAGWNTAVREGLRRSLKAGYRILADGGSAVDAAEQAVRELERDEHFNAGRGSVLDAQGNVTMDASIMSGREREAGAVAALSDVMHPVSGARLVMERTDHVLLVGAGASVVCRQHGLASATPEDLVTELRIRQLEQSRQQRDSGGQTSSIDDLATVGAVALDAEGNLAAATSTGGITNKHPGRVGDSAIIGAGTWADNSTCAVSATGVGETIMRVQFAHQVHALMAYRGLPLDEACRNAVESVVSMGGAVGCVAVNAVGRIAMPFSTPAMPRGVMRAPGDAEIAIRQDE